MPQDTAAWVAWAVWAAWLVVENNGASTVWMNWRIGPTGALAGGETGAAAAVVSGAAVRPGSAVAGEGSWTDSGVMRSGRAGGWPVAGAAMVSMRVMVDGAGVGVCR